MSLNNQNPGVALITGASSGIGAFYADRLARRGYDLILVARNRDRLDALASDIRGKTGRAVEIIAADLTDDADLGKVAQVLRTNEAITLLVNNAGIGTTTPLLESDAGDMLDMIKINVNAPMALTYAAAPGFVQRHHGAIINISSIVAVAPALLNGVYGGSKAFVMAFTESLHHELGSKGIRVQAVLPGVTATDFWQAAGKSVDTFPEGIVMHAGALVDAALAGFDLGEVFTIPSLPDIEDWNAYVAARDALTPNLSHREPAARYRSA